MKLARAVRLLLVSGALAMSLVSPQMRPARAASDTTTLFVANNQWTTNFDPAIDYGQVGPVIFRNCYEALIRLKYTSTSQYEGVLATNWSSNAAKTVWTFNLRQGVHFHDGTLFNAEAVRYSINRILAINQAPVFIMGQYMNRKSVKVLGPYKVEFDLTVPAPRLLAAMASQWGNWIVSPSTIKAHTQKNDLGQAWLASHDAGTGPYILSQVVPNSSVTLVRFPGYWGGWSGKHVNRIVMTYVPEEQVRRSLIEKGDIDLTLTFSPQNLRQMERNPQVQVDLTPGVLLEDIVFTVYGPFASPLARQALAYAFDYNAMNNDFLKGFAIQAQGAVAHHIFGHDSALPLYHTDLNKARQLFAAAGVKPTTITAWYSSGDVIGRQMALITQAQLGQLGFNVVITEHDFNTFLNDELGNERASQRPLLWVYNWFPDYSDVIDATSVLFHTKAGGVYGLGNAGLYSNKEVDRLLAQAAVETDPVKQQQMYNRIQYILDISDPSGVFISDTSYEEVYRSNLHGFFDNPVYGNTFYFYPMSKS